MYILNQRRTYEYEDAIHVTLPALNKGTIIFLSVGETYRPDFCRIVYGRSRCKRVA